MKVGWAYPDVTILIELCVTTLPRYSYPSMRLTAFFSGAIIVLNVAPIPMAPAREPSIVTATVAQTSTREPIMGDFSFRDGATVEPTLLISQQSPPPRRLQFAPGAISAVVEGNVVRGTRAIYLLRARGRQTMKVNITSLEQNAVFDIQAPNGEYLQQEVTNWQGVLPRTGDYSVIVSGTRGNASYKLEVTIK